MAKLRKTILYFFLILFMSLTVKAQTPPPPQNSTAPPNSWDQFENEIQKKSEQQKLESLSFIISGSLAITAGLLGQNSTQDPIEDGTYALFQTIGVSALGYGFSLKYIADSDQDFYEILFQSELNTDQKSRLIDQYKRLKQKRERREKIIKALTHLTIAGISAYNASQLENEGLKRGLYTFGGINLLLSLSYSF